MPRRKAPQRRRRQRRRNLFGLSPKFETLRHPTRVEFNLLALDHVSADVIVQDPSSEIRPYVTVAIDWYSRIGISHLLSYHMPDE